MKYLGIILDHKFRFNEHIKYTAERCGKLIHSLSRAAKMTWGIKHAAMATIYKVRLKSSVNGWISQKQRELKMRPRACKGTDQWRNGT